MQGFTQCSVQFVADDDEASSLHRLAGLLALSRMLDEAIGWQCTVKPEGAKMHVLCCQHFFFLLALHARLPCVRAWCGDVHTYTPTTIHTHTRTQTGTL